VRLEHRVRHVGRQVLNEQTAPARTVSALIEP
jgi:hypothetical protein